MPRDVCDHHPVHKPWNLKFLVPPPTHASFETSLMAGEFRPQSQKDDMQVGLAKFMVLKNRKSYFNLMRKQVFGKNIT